MKPPTPLQCHVWERLACTADQQACFGSRHLADRWQACWRAGGSSAQGGTSPGPQKQWPPARPACWRCCPRAHGAAARPRAPWQMASAPSALTPAQCQTSPLSALRRALTRLTANTLAAKLLNGLQASAVMPLLEVKGPDLAAQRGATNVNVSFADLCVGWTGLAGVRRLQPASAVLPDTPHRKLLALPQLLWPLLDHWL